MHERRLRVGTFTPSLLIHLARSSGALARAGLAVQEDLVASSPAQFLSLEAGEYDAIFTNPDNVLAYHFLSANPLRRHIPLKIIAGLDRGLGLSLCVAPTISDVNQVRGGVLSVDVPQSGFAFVAYGLLELAGLSPGQYDIEALGSTPRRAAALIEGSCSATVLNAGNELRAIGAGCSVVSRVEDLGPYLGTVLATRADDEPSLQVANHKFADVLLVTAREILAGERESEAIEAAQHLLELNQSEALAHYRCLRNSASGFLSDAKVDLASITTLIDLRRAYSPTPELDGIIDAIGTVVADGVLD